MKGVISINKSNKTKQHMVTKLIEDTNILSIIANPIRKKILTILANKAYYPAELAKILKMHEQKVYYHIKQLLNGEFIEEKERKEIRGTVAKKYKTTSFAYSFILKDEWKEEKITIKPEEDLFWFFEPFIKNNKYDCNIVVGSPDPHGKYKSYARDGHYTIDLSLLMGKLANLPNNFSVLLDVDVKKEKKQNENMILIGGPITNSLSYDLNLNNKLLVEFGDNPSSIKSKKTGKIYYEDSIGVIQFINNPYDESKFILHIAGIRAIGTKSAILAITRDRSVVRKAFMSKKRPFSMIVQGFDIDGDGEIESIEIIE